LSNKGEIFFKKDFFAFEGASLFCHIFRKIRKNPDFIVFGMLFAMAAICRRGMKVCIATELTETTEETPLNSQYSIENIQ